MRCPECGNEIEKGQKFCMKCGTKIEREPENKKWKALFIIGLLVVIFLIIAFAFLLFAKTYSGNFDFLENIKEKYSITGYEEDFLNETEYSETVDNENTTELDEIKSEINDAEETDSASSESNEKNSVDEENTFAKQLDWSEWSEKIPEYVTKDKYDIEEQVLYSSRTLEKTTSNKSFMNGWELYDSKEGKGEYGPWSDWSENQPVSKDGRKIENEWRYRYRDKETKTSSSSSMTGWTKYDETYEWGNYGSWSDWSTNSVSSSESRKTETKTQYSYRDKSYTTSSSSSMSGWTLYDTIVSYGDWSSWQNGYISETDTREVETKSVSTQRYYIGHYCTGKYASKPYQTDSYKFSDECAFHALGWYDSLDGFIQSNGGYITDPHTKCDNTCYTWYIIKQEGSITWQYRYRDIYYTYKYYKWGDWSSFSDTYYSSSGDREVQTRTMYRYADREKIYTYHFYRWGEWSDWNTNQYSNSSTREVEKTKFYRYCDRVTEKTYYFKRWTSWSDYSEKAVYANDSTEVKTKTVYRYKLKD